MMLNHWIVPRTFVVMTFLSAVEVVATDWMGSPQRQQAAVADGVLAWQAS